MTDTTFFVEQIDRESWKVDHETAMECRDLEELLRHGLGFFYMVRLADEGWSKKVQSGATPFDEKTAREIRAGYEWWLSPCDEVIERVNRLEKHYRVDHADAFLECYRLAKRIVGINLDDLLESVRQAEAGNTEPLTGEVWVGVSGPTNTES